MAISTSCGVYSFTGVSLDPRIKTVSIQNFYDEVGSGPPTMSQNFTQSFQDYFVQNTDLKLVPFDGDLQFEGSITGYRISPISPQAGGSNQIENADIAGLQRLTITVKCSYLNTYDESFDFNKGFSFFKDYNPDTEPFSSNEDAFIEEIFDQIILDIFNASVQNW